MKIKAKDIKIGDTIGDLIIRSEMEAPFKSRLFTCSCACGNIVQRLDAELEYFPTFRQCNNCMRREKEAKEIWNRFMEALRDKEVQPLPGPSRVTELYKLFFRARLVQFDELSRIFTVSLPFTNRVLETWEPIAQKLNITIRFVA